MNVAQDLKHCSEKQETPVRAPVTERLETAIGGDLARYLLSALSGHGASRGEPR